MSQRDYMSPLLRAALEERLAEMSSRESAEAAVNAQRLFKIAEKEPNVHDPWLFAFRMERDILVGTMLNMDADSRRKTGG